MSLKRKKLLNQLLANHLGVEPDTILIETTEHGKPFLVQPNPSLYFNTSHCDDVFLVAIGQTPIGIDIEKMDDRVDYLSVAQQFFTEQECQHIHLSENPERSFYQLWTQKEALLKLEGKALKDGFLPPEAIDGMAAFNSHAIPIPLPYIAHLAFYT